MRDMANLRNYEPQEVTVAEAADTLCLSVRAVQARIASGTLPARKVGRGKTAPYLIPLAAVKQALAESRRKQADR